MEAARVVPEADAVPEVRADAAVLEAPAVIAADFSAPVPDPRWAAAGIGPRADPIPSDAAAAAVCSR